MMASAPELPVRCSLQSLRQPAAKPDRRRVASVCCCGSRAPPRSRRRSRFTLTAIFRGCCSRRFFLAPDLTMLAYLAGPRVGASGL